jgi:hypothetical protein
MRRERAGRSKCEREDAGSISRSHVCLARYRGMSRVRLRCLQPGLDSMPPAWSGRSTPASPRR